MSDPEKKPASGETPDNDRSSGPSLKLIYSLIALAVVAALFFAGMIVLPFYRGRH